MPMLLLSPTESELSKLFGDRAVTSLLTEEKGADILAYTKQGLLGIQRKSVPHDLIRSIEDGRLVREMDLLQKSCKFCLLILEGKLRYWPDGHIFISKRINSRFTKAQIRGLLNDVKYIRGVGYDFTDDTQDTVAYIDGLVKYMNSDKHMGMFNRPSAKGTWIVPSVKDIHLWILQSFAGIGPSTATGILQRFGTIPLKWTCSLDELMSVSGLSKAKAIEIFGMLNEPPPDSYYKQEIESIAKGKGRQRRVVEKENTINRPTIQPSVFDNLRKKLGV